MTERADQAGRAGPAHRARDIRLLLGARCAMSSVQALAGIVVPIYLAQLGFDAVRLGTLFVAVALVTSGFSTVIGLWCDRVGRKPFLIALPALTALATAAYAVTPDAVVLYLAAAIGAFGRGGGAGGGSVGPYQPAEQALLAELAPASGRNRLFGRFAAGSAAGALLGAALAAASQTDAGAHLDGPGPYRPLFLAMTALSAVAALLPIPVREPSRTAPDRRRRQDREPRPARPPRPARTRLGLPRNSRSLIYKLWATNGINGMAVGLFGPFVSYWFYRKFGVGPSHIGGLFVVINLVSIGTNLAAHRLASAVGTLPAIVGARVAQGFLLIPMVLVPHYWMAGGIYLLRVVVQRLGMPLRQSFIMGLAEPSERGAVAALSRLPQQLLSTAAPTLTGYLFSAVSLALPFQLAGVLQMSGALLFHRFFRHAVIDGEDGQRAGRTVRQ